MPAALSCSGLAVRYGDFTALDAFSAEFRAGAIHAVVGQNGAGKTSFARACAGLVKPAAGLVSVSGTAIAPGDVTAARRAGIELVHQNFALPPSFTVSEVMEFGATAATLRPYGRAELDARWREHLARVGVTAAPSTRIRDLPVETLQSVEIARALVRQARILILDEPTATLSPAGIERLFQRVRILRDAGVTVLIVLHKVHEILAVADTVTVLRDGRHVVGPAPATAMNATTIVGHIIGSAASGEDPDRDAALGAAVGTGAAAPGRSPERGPAVLRLSGVSTVADEDGPRLAGIDLVIAAGEIVGVAGVEGNGQRHLVGAISGLTRLAAGTIELTGGDATASTPLKRRAAGLRIIPFERNTEGLSLTTSLWENWAIGDLLADMRRAIRPRLLRNACRAALSRWNVRFSTVEQVAGSLSGGNAQKVILAREITNEARLVIAAQPTRGLDVGATEFVWQALRQASRNRCGILLISSDLDELFDMSDRIVVLQRGAIVARFSPPFDLHDIGAAMTLKGMGGQ